MPSGPGVGGPECQGEEIANAQLTDQVGGTIALEFAATLAFGSEGPALARALARRPLVASRQAATITLWRLDAWEGGAPPLIFHRSQPSIAPLGANRPNVHQPEPLPRHA